MNPALVDQVKLLLQSITENVATDDDADGVADDSGNDGRDGETSARTASTRTGASTGTGASSGRLIASDMQVVREIVRMRSRLKASQMEMHRHAVIGSLDLDHIHHPFLYTLTLPLSLSPLTFPCHITPTSYIFLYPITLPHLPHFLSHPLPLFFVTLHSSSCSASCGKKRRSGDSSHRLFHHHRRAENRGRSDRSGCFEITSFRGHGNQNGGGR